MAKSILLGAGAIFAGHYDDLTARQLKLSLKDSPVFATAHMQRSVLSGGRRLLLIRSPVDVAVSMVTYIQTRPDHRRHRIFAGHNVWKAIALVLDGVDGLPPLAERYRRFRSWAEENDARIIDYEQIKSDPQFLLQQCAMDHIQTKDSVVRNLARWNPTKRVKRLPQEAEIKERLLEIIQDRHASLWNEYQVLRARA